ncbi:MAG TPA: TlpA disulfide reductase family protein [Pyrinomonadaceae bacterium]|jgi:thiol-disulfide isomerase/thioredoxin
MRPVLLLTLAALLAAAGARAQTPPPAAVAHVGAPKFMPEEITGREFKDLDGRAFRLSDFGGRVYVLNLWATWCGPCRVETPEINKLREEYARRGVEVVGLTTEDPERDLERVRGFARELRVSYRLGWIDKETARLMTSWGPPRSTPPRPGLYSLPQTFVVAADGQIVLHVRGYNPRVPEMIRAGVEKALALSKPAPAAAAPGRR